MQNFDCNYPFSIDLEPNGIMFDVNSIKKLELLLKFDLIFQNSGGIDVSYSVCYYEWAKRTKFLLAVIYVSPGRLSDSS